MFRLFYVGQVSILGNLKEPGFNGAFAAVFVDILQYLKEGFLSDLLGNIRAFAHGQDEEIDVFEIQSVHFLEIHGVSPPLLIRLPGVRFVTGI